MNNNYSQLLREAITRISPVQKRGQVAQYIPQLSQIEPGLLGVSLYLGDGACHSSGDCDKRFTLQSISKVFALILALQDQGEGQIFNKVGMEPTGDPFNSLIKLETAALAKPLNPMINAGAIAVTSQIAGKDNDEKLNRLISFLRQITGSEKIGLDKAVYQSERATGDRNRALAYLLKDMGIIEGIAEEVLDLYFSQCAISVNCSELAKLGHFLARHGTGEFDQVHIFSKYIKIALTFMVTCGMYNSSGEFAIKVGIPAKSGVSGGIMAVVPNRMGIGVYGPALDNKGNSLGGVEILEYLAEKLNLGIF